ncbi:MAG: L-threonylcarbamoyladenylate synthase [Ginsengibacter sp.]
MNSFENDIKFCLETLNNGGLILYPTDTIWGIGCDATNSEAIKKVYELKKREEKKSLITLVSDENMIRNYVSNVSEKLLKYISEVQKPTTVIFKNAINLPARLVNEDGSIAMRIPKDEFCLQLITKLGKPLVSTSANISGEKFPQNFSEVSEAIKNGVDYIVQHRQHDNSENSPSSIIRLDEKGNIEIIR